MLSFGVHVTPWWKILGSPAQFWGHSQGFPLLYICESWGLAAFVSASPIEAFASPAVHVTPIINILLTCKIIKLQMFSTFASSLAVF